MHGVLRYIAVRLAIVVPLVFGLTLVAFVLLRLGNASPAVLVAGPFATEEQIQDISRSMGLDRSILVQYWDYTAGIFMGEWGTSWRSGLPVTEELYRRLPATLEMVLFGMFLAVVFGVVLGVGGALRQGTWVDAVLRVGSLVGVSMPIFWIALLTLFLGFSRTGWLPSPLGRLSLDVSPPDRVTGLYTVDSLLAGELYTFLDALWHLLGPGLAIMLVSGGTIAKQVRASFVEAIGDPAVIYARAQGLRRREVVWLTSRIALPTVFSFIAIVFSLTFGGSSLLEIIFSWGGIGQFGVTGAVESDFAVVQAYVLVMGFATAAIYLLADLIGVVLDPRISLRS